jgi:serine/threonine protein phosphatase PrpC
MTLSVYGATERGSVRKENQDTLVAGGCVAFTSGARLTQTLPLDTPQTVAVIDGMGGYIGGKQAAGIAAMLLAGNTVLTAQPTAEQFERLSVQMSAYITLAGDAWDMPEMGSVFAALTFAKNGVYAANVGDCRAYRIEKGSLTQLSVDDRNDQGFITQALGNGSMSFDPHLSFYAYGGDCERYFICSDGLYGIMSTGALAALMDFDAEFSLRLCDDIAKLAYSLGAPDNFTFALCEVNNEKE